MNRVSRFLTCLILVGTFITGSAFSISDSASASAATAVTDSSGIDSAAASYSYGINSASASCSYGIDSAATVTGSSGTNSATLAAASDTATASKVASTKTSSDTDPEFRAVWIKYGNFDKSKKYTEDQFRSYADHMFQNVENMGMNAAIVHVRPFSDAMYPSQYYPWSIYASGERGKDPGYDPLAILVDAAHSHGIEFHAWINPYRVTYSTTDISYLAESSPARKWLTNKKTTDDRNVLAYLGKLYMNPAKSAVRKLIINGVKEIVENYDVDGIHFDDYFYPDLTSSGYTTNFDAPEYNSYVEAKKAAGKTYMDIVSWRRNNVNLLVKGVYSAIKAIRPDVVFGIAPAGAYKQLYENHRNYVDYRTWMSTPGYIDYICPELYWSFNKLNPYPYYETLQAWLSSKVSDTVKFYVGLPAYKVNENVALSTSNKNTDTEWYNQFILADMIYYARRTGLVDGFVFFDYEDMIDSKNATVVENVKEMW